MNTTPSTSAEPSTRDAEIANMYRNGYNAKTIAAKTGLSTRTVYRALTRTKVRDLKTPPPRPVLTDHMVALLKDGASYTDVAETFSVSVKWLRETMPGYGWDGHTSGMLAHALKNPTARRLHHEIRKIALPSDQENKTS